MPRTWPLVLTVVLAACAGSPAPEPAGPGQIHGTLRDSWGGALDNLELQLLGPQGLRATAVSGGGGTYEFFGLAEGAYDLSFDPEAQSEGPVNYEPASWPGLVIQAENGFTVTHNLVLTPTGEAGSRLAQKYAGDWARFAQEAQEPRARGAVVFAGSSTIRLWPRLAADFPEHRVLNRGFGGSTVYELLEAAPEILIPLEPSALVIYEGDNDLSVPGASVESFLAASAALGRLFEGQLPRERIIFMAIKPSIARWHLWPLMQRANEGLAALARERGYGFADIATPLLALQGQPDPQNYVADGLHLSAAGYALITPKIRDLLR